MHAGKIMPLHAGSAGRVLLAWDAELADAVLAGPLPSITEATVTDHDLLRTLIDRTRSDGYAITTAERGRGVGSLDPRVRAAAEIASALSIMGPTIRLPRTRCE